MNELYAVTAKELTKSFGDFFAVDRISFSVKRGEIFGFLGPNGAGKSTTIKMLCGILRPSGGQASISGLDIYDDAEKIKMNIGYMSQKFSLYEDLTVEENIDFYSGIYCLDAQAKKERKSWLLDMAGLLGHENVLTGLLPIGWRQRLALGCAMLHEPSIIFLDEPTSAVDPIYRRNFWDLIYELANAGTTVFVTTHYMDEAEYCDRLALIYQGKIAALGSPDELKARHLKTALFSLTAEEPFSLLEKLKALPFIKDASLFGSGLHICLKDASSEGALRQFLAQSGLAASDLCPIKPSLEDVFISVIENSSKATAKEGM